jgi:hypothetical protein
MIVDDTHLEIFLETALRNPVNAALLDRLPQLGLTDCWLVAGCLFQAVWNEQAGHDPVHGVKDYDVFYCDVSDLSYDAEDLVIRRVAAAVADLGVTVEVKNQARVHLWYRDKFGEPYPRLTRSTEGIDRFLVAGTCVGISASPGRRSGGLYATHGLGDIYSGILRPNPLIASANFAAKAESYRARWPHLKIVAEPAVRRQGPAAVP